MSPDEGSVQVEGSDPVWAFADEENTKNVDDNNE